MKAKAFSGLLLALATVIVLSPGSAVAILTDGLIGYWAWALWAGDGKQAKA